MGAKEVMVMQSGDSQHRSAVELGVIEAIEQMDAAGTGGRKADAQPPGIFTVGARHESRGFFVANLYEADFLLPLAKRFHDPVDAVARQAKDGIHSPFGEFFNEYVCGS